MKTLLLTIASAITLNSFSQAPTIQWQNYVVGNKEEYIRKTIQTSSGDYVSVGVTNSTTGDFASYHGAFDGWITKADAQGNFIWKKNIGGSNSDYLMDVIQTIDGNYIAVGVNHSSDGDLSSIPYSTNLKGIWLMKFDDNGTILWQTKIGGPGLDINAIIKESPNGELNLFTSTSASSLDVQTHYGAADTYDLVYFRLNSAGTILEQRTFGGSHNEHLTGVSETLDGGFVVLTTSFSIDHDISNHVDSIYTPNAWVIKLDANRNLAWEKSFLMHSWTESTRSIKSLSNGNIIFTYEKNSFVPSTYTDGTVMMLDPQGSLIWEKDFGGNSHDVISDILEINPNEIILIGSTHSDSIIVNNSNGGIWLLNIDQTGAINWQNTYDLNGTWGSYYKIDKTSDNGLILSAGVQAINPGCMCVDASSIKFSPLSVGLKEQTKNVSFSVYPNPAKDHITINLKNSSENIVYEITNAIGQIVLSGKLEQEKSTINITELSSGVYILQIGDEQKQSYKLIKE